MNYREKLKVRQEEVIAELSSLVEMRRGSITEQYMESVRKDGSKVRRGPYYLYTFKEKGKTVSRRIKASEAKTYQEQIDNFRRFKELTSELRSIGEQLGDLKIMGEEEVKKTPNMK